MITLDYEQSRVLAEVARIIRRARGRRVAKRAHRNLRRIAIAGLSISRWLNPRRFEEWDRSNPPQPWHQQQHQRTRVTTCQHAGTIAPDRCAPSAAMALLLPMTFPIEKSGKFWVLKYG
jgi:hypothetical protein